MPPPPVGFEPTISAGEWPKTFALNRAATFRKAAKLKSVTREVLQVIRQTRHLTLPRFTTHMHISIRLSFPLYVLLICLFLCFLPSFVVAAFLAFFYLKFHFLYFLPFHSFYFFLLSSDKMIKKAATE
jgi:hypothetical protein